MEQYNMQAIPTFFNGNKFRSRLEARWAVFFTEMGIKYEYEPEGFLINYGLKYLPDFVLTNVYCEAFGRITPIFVEVKGKEQYKDIDTYSQLKIEKFSEKQPILVVGKIPYSYTEPYFGSDYRKPDEMFSMYFINKEPEPCFFSKSTTMGDGKVALTKKTDKRFNPASAEKALLCARFATFEFQNATENAVENIDERGDVPW